ncbi:MAG: hypothetical protein EX271_07105 [Acidimicrobiales bacterium]|nr:hypothetical protein [Hyphomonadaceae bacterium]RZV41873.1 MAG: hypothetical protein EX271_07105 [Acidimicrobiales bacterium]
MEYHWYDFIGNIGVALILLTYLALQLDKIDAKGLAYSLINGIGALCILISLAYAFNMSAFIIEAAWLLISIFGVILTMRRRNI